MEMSRLCLNIPRAVPIVYCMVERSMLKDFIRYCRKANPVCGDYAKVVEDLVEGFIKVSEDPATVELPDFLWLYIDISQDEVKVRLHQFDC